MIRAYPATEYTIYIPSGGNPFILDQGSGRFVLTEEGTGMPPIEYVTERGPFQNGETVRGKFLRPRVVTMRVRANSCSRDLYWSSRSDLLNAIRPNRGEGTLRRILSNGKTRDLKCYIETGPNFQPRKLDAWDEWAYDEILRFVAHNPVYYDPTVKTVEWTSPICGEFPYTFPIFLACPLQFPITFPLVFYHFGGEDSVTIDYQGNWEEYPSFTITGPLSTIKIYNLTTDESITIQYDLLEGENIVIDLGYARKTVTLDDGTNLAGSVSADSDLATFHLEPGDNAILIEAYGAGANTSVVMSYYHRYIGLGG